MAVGDRTNLRLAQSVSPASSLRKASRHPRGILVAWMCSNLLALPPNRLDKDELAGLPFSFLYGLYHLKRLHPSTSVRAYSALDVLRSVVVSLQYLAAEFQPELCFLCN